LREFERAFAERLKTWKIGDSEPPRGRKGTFSGPLENDDLFAIVNAVESKAERWHDELTAMDKARSMELRLGKLIQKRGNCVPGINMDGGRLT
jgi:hypothetical protein